MKYNFINTSDEETKQRLVDRGFKLISKNGSIYTFLNDCTLVFEDKNNKIQYTNMLYI